MLNLQTIRERLGPDFQPFVLRLTDGRKFAVPHRDFITVGKGIVVHIDQEDVARVFDALHIVSVEDMPKKGGKSKSGKIGAR